MFLIFGETLFQKMGRPVPEAIKTCFENKWTYGFGAYFLLGNIQSSLISTGAFEIYINDAEAYSKIKAGHMPSEQELRRIMSQFGI